MKNDFKPELKVTLAPGLLSSISNLEESTIVVIDVLRATSTIAAALYNGAQAVIPVSSVERCKKIGLEKQVITAGERGGKKIADFQLGNSPLDFTPSVVKGKEIVLTTTNGTKLLQQVLNAGCIVTGSFPNFSMICRFLSRQTKPVLLACTGWRGRVNLEDALFAGAVVHQIKEYFHLNDDSALITESLFLQNRNDLFRVVEHSSHYLRLKEGGKLKDIEYCFTNDIAPCLPFYEKDRLINKIVL